MYRFSALLAIVVAVGGCGGGSNVKGFTRVSGKVLYKGEPLANANVEFFPVDSQVGMPSLASVQKGAYFVDVAPGKYNIAVRAFEGELKTEMPQVPTGGGLVMQDQDLAKKMKKEGKLQERKSAIPDKYSVAATSGFTVDVANKSVSYDLKIE